MSKKSSIHTRQRIERLDIILLIILSIWVLLILFPFYEALMSSLVNSIEFTKHPIIIWPQHFVLDNYRTIFDYTNLLNGYKNTLIVVLIGVPIHLFLTVSTGYVFSQDFPGRKILFKLFPLIQEITQCLVIRLPFSNIIIWKKMPENSHALIIG